jgi:hypothetical protein
MSIAAGAKAGFGALKSHWIFFAVLFVVLILLAINYDAKNKTFSNWRDKVATFPIIGGLFAPCLLVLVGFAAHAAHATLALSRMVG